MGHEVRITHEEKVCHQATDDERLSKLDLLEVHHCETKLKTISIRIKLSSLLMDSLSV